MSNHDIAVLGWGSLIWDSRDLNLESPEWRTGGPRLPIEFSRISRSRGGALTLVIDQADGAPCETLWAVHADHQVTMAVRDLAAREGTSTNQIGYVSGGETYSRNSSEIAGAIRDWMTDTGLCAVIWADLRPNFRDLSEVGFSAAAAATILAALPAASLANAKEYMTRAPIDTRARGEIMRVLGWSFGGN